MDIASMVDRRPLVIFSKSSCAMCHSIESLMRQFGANLTVYELDQIGNGRHVEATLLQMGCRPSVPAVFIGQRFVGGADAVMSLHLQGKLVPMLIAAGAIFMWHRS
ncbi:Glutaredoxin-like [Parasponia andersonii]|uniref:Glutaredoxin-like n=1 Tax=Parasponia andersonii TaxID=3476 RepID=A0A2P5C7W2_PARAD|nr:Glutaredoxin-like [Parasponia andersonii]